MNAEKKCNEKHTSEEEEENSAHMSLMFHYNPIIATNI